MARTPRKASTRRTTKKTTTRKARGSASPASAGSARSSDLNIDLLRRLCEMPGVPGREERVRELIESEIDGLFDEVRTDAMGNLICTRKSRSKSSKNPTRVMLLCHMDEIGFYVSSIDENGFLWLNNAGGFDPRNLFSRRVLVCTKHGDFKGVMNPGGRPIHISAPEERSKVPQVKEFFVDIGRDVSEVTKLVQVGDFVVMDEPFIEVGKKVVSKALDNRFACWIGIESIRKLVNSKKSHACEIVVAFTTQEEVGLRGAKTSSFAVQPDIGLGLDVTLSCDTPGVPASEAVTKQGSGFGLHIKDGSFIANADLVDEIEACAIKHKITYQRTILAAGGQDGAAAQQAAAGARAVGITCGTRYIHTVTEMIDTRDLGAARDVVTAYLAEVK
ncbi:MAG: M20/M25/M40 family metallo-hydrolase [Phycisphaeraceae bacterium]|nr:M20/M25/M40 family metallo-hydrolase [Phycisphaerales bacterium]MCB9861302.1 M20/M25/M40 family metallo-hydrolase [Phycisphaeraceae bacterium]